MNQIEPWPINEDPRVPHKASRLAYFLESAAIVLLALLAAYAASA
jgi:hypothetical protein